MRLQLVLFPWLMLLSVVHSYRILGVFPFFAKSHFVIFEQLMKGLARKGHQVDVISMFPLKKPVPNYTDIIVLETKRVFVNNLSYSDMKNLIGSLPVHPIATLGGNEQCEILGHPTVQKILKNPSNDPPYDAVLIEVFGANCFTAFGHVLNIPTIGVSSSIMYPWSHKLIANPENLAFIPNSLLSFNTKMNFWYRLYNFLHASFNKLYFNYLTKEQDDIVRKHLGPGLPGIRELEKEISLILVNSHQSMNEIKPLTPALIEVGGLHVQDDNLELPANLEKWMNESTHGFIYFTFGSMLTIESFPAEYLKIFYESLGKIAPIRVLMKIPNPGALPPGLPSNVLTNPWMPQIKVLKHRNVKAFITHGGLMGTLEAVHCGVPMIGMPVFGDQFINIETYARKKIAIKLDLSTLTVEKMDAAIDAILHEPIYRETMRNVSALFLDRPMAPIDTANYWIEYVIRHGADALKSPAMSLTWWQRELLDVYLFLLFVTLIIISSCVFMISCILNRSDDSRSRVAREKKVS